MYSLHIIDYSKVRTPDEYNAIVSGAPHYCFKKLHDVRSFIGASLRRGRCGYYATIGNLDYVVKKISD